MMLETEIFRVEPDVVVLSCSGRFTMGTRLSETEALSNTLIDEGVRKLVLDLTHTVLVDSAGLGVIIHMFAVLEQHGGYLRVAGANERVRNLLNITHTNTILQIDSDVETSVAWLQEKRGAASVT